MTVNKELLLSQLSDSPLKKGDVVLVHSSLKAVGWIEPGPEALVEAFLETIGKDGTLVAPTLVPALRGIRPWFEVKTTPSEMGLFTELVRKWPGAIRSDHQTHSVSAVGARAEQLCEKHRAGWGPSSPWGKDALGFGTPWDKLREWNAWVMLVGVDFGSCTILHHAQARYLDAMRGVTWKDPWPEFDFRAMGEALAREGLVTRVTLGGAECLMARAGTIVDRALELLDNDEARFFRQKHIKEWLSARRRIASFGRMKAATFKVNVTPDKLEKKVGRPLHIRGVLLDHPRAGKMAHLVWDHGAFLSEDGDPIREAVSKASGVPFEKVLLTATHTHTGYWQPYWPHPEYRDFVIGRVAQPIREAAGRMEPVRAGWRTVHAPGIGRSRTVYLKDGRAYTERWAIPSSWHVPQSEIAHRGPADEELRMLVLERLDGRRLAVCLNLSCHNSAALKDSRVTDDLFGVAAEIVENAEGCVTLVSPGSEGDQDPTALVELGGERDMEYARKLGERLAGYALVGLADVRMHDLFEASAGSCRVEIAVKNEWKEAAERTGSSFFQRRAREGKDTAEVSILAVGDYAMVGVSAELFTLPAIHIREHSPFAITSVMALTNGNVLYMAEKEAFFKGSIIYGTENRFPEMAVAGSDEIIVKAGIEMVRQAKADMNAQRDRA